LVAVTSHGAPDPSDLSGRTISHFRVLEPLGAGGMGVVYRAEDVTLGRTVALKFMLPNYAIDETASARFLREARSVAGLDHQNICTVHEVGRTEEGHLFLAMTYYAGETLRDRLTRGGPLPVIQALDVAWQIASGLSRAHHAGIVHRDLKPANVMLTPDGTVKILDFGLAKARDQTMTASGGIMGTVAYMSPEQLLGEQVDARTDLWSLGVVLFEMLTGQHPSRGDDVPGTLTRQIEARRPPEVRPEVTGSLRGLVERLLRRDPAERYQSADELLADLAVLRGRIGASTGGATGQTHAGAAGSMRRLAALGATALLIVAGAVGVLWWRSTRTQGDGDSVTGTARTTLSLAVLPLKNYSGPDQEYFADGMTEELTSTLTKIERLRVIAHQSVAQFKRSDRPVPEIARMLDVKYVVDGSVRQDEGHVRITASLIDAARNAPVWTNTFDRDRHDVMNLQRDVALAIAQEVQVTLTPEDRSRLAPARSVDPDAFESYIKGTQARYDANFTSDFREATRYLSTAIAKDSAYAPPYAGLAFISAFEGDEARARELVSKALALDPNDADAHLTLGVIRQFFDWDWVGAERAFREALTHNPGFAEAIHELSELHMRQRRFDEALREAQHSVELAPMSARFLNAVGEVYAFSGRLEDALAIAKRVLEKDSTFSGGYFIQAAGYEVAGRLEDAEKTHEKCRRVAPGCDVLARLGYIYAATGRRAQAMRVRDTLMAKLQDAKRATERSSLAMDIAGVHVGLGERTEALAWLERAVGFHNWMLYLAIDPIYRPLYGEPRFQAVLRKIGLDSASNASR
jgi:TolB-like protein/Flp pilus assembly protein TadD